MGRGLLISCHILNGISSKTLGFAPYEKWRKKNVDDFILWGYITPYRVFDCKKMKLNARALKRVFVGYTLKLKGYWILNSGNAIVETKNAELIENSIMI